MNEQPINARWKACEVRMVKAFGWPRFDVLIEPLIPLRYDGTTLVLGAPTPWLRDFVMRQHNMAARLTKILGQPLRIECSDIARAAAANRPPAWQRRETLPARLKVLETLDSEGDG